jgi:hypothetical protein
MSWAPIALMAVSTVAQVAGAASSYSNSQQVAQGEIAQGNAQREAAQYRAQVARNNAKMAEGDAEYVMQAGALESYNQAMKNRAHLGNVKANQAASGVNINTGTAVDVRASEAATGRQEQQNIEANAGRRAYGYRREAQDYLATAALAEKEGDYDVLAARNRAQSALNEGRSTVLGTASSLAFKWGSYLEKS